MATEIAAATVADDAVVCDHYLRLWEGYGVPPEHILADARERILAFIVQGRAELELAAFVCRAGTAVVGSACCQVRRSPYPEVIVTEHRKVGYVWSLYVDPAHRRQGLARRMTDACLAHLRAIGCRTVLLHSSQAGLPLYRAMGFEPTSELRLTL